MLSKMLKQFSELAKDNDAYWVEKAKLDFSIALEGRRRGAGLSYAAIARKIGTSAAYISKVFRGDANLTIESMTKLARSAGGRLHIEIVDERVDARRWLGTVMNLRAPAANQPLITAETKVAENILPIEDTRLAA